MTVLSFNSRAREGRDSHNGGYVSIGFCFNSRAREGRDFFFAVPIRLIDKFQFTRPRGARQYCHIRNRQNTCFNSRAREGRDLTYRDAPPSLQKFQFTRPRGARPVDMRHAPQCLQFQFTRPRGARHGG